MHAYAAMVSAMEFEDVAYTTHLSRRRPGQDINARAELLAFLGAPDGDELVISSEVRIILVSADFGRGLMTTVLWLNRFEGLDIRCVQLLPCRLADRVVLDVWQIVRFPKQPTTRSECGARSSSANVRSETDATSPATTSSSPAKSSPTQQEKRYAADHLKLDRDSANTQLPLVSTAALRALCRYEENRMYARWSHRPTSVRRFTAWPFGWDPATARDRKGPDPPGMPMN
jgi:hypothetical protein